jgi:hypothetical protein
VLETLGPLALKVAAHYGSKSHPEALRLLPLTPAKYEGLPQRDLPDAMDKIEAALNDGDTAAAVKKLGAEFVGLLGPWRKQKKERKDADAALTKTQKAVAVAKDAVLEAHARLDGQLRALFPRQRKKVASYWRAKPVAAVKAGEAAPQPDGPGGGK